MQPISLVCLVVGIMLLVFGFSAGDSVASKVSEAVTGNPTDRSIWLLIGGADLTVIGAAGLMRGRKTKRMRAQAIRSGMHCWGHS